MKHWFLSKTLWVNAIAIVALIINGQWGWELDAEQQAMLVTGVLAVANIILRFFTKTSLTK